MWNTKDLQNSISKQIVTLCCQLVIFENYLSHSQPWNTFEKPPVCFSWWTTEHAQRTRLCGNVLSTEQLWCWKRQSFTKYWPLIGLLQKDQLKQFEYVSWRNDSSFDSIPSLLSDYSKAMKQGPPKGRWYLKNCTEYLPCLNATLLSYQIYTFTPPYVMLRFCDCNSFVQANGLFL